MRGGNNGQRFENAVQFLNRENCYYSERLVLFERQTSTLRKRIRCHHRFDLPESRNPSEK